MTIISADATDIIYQGGIAFYWDDTRAKWLSLCVEAFEFAYDGSLSGGWMKFSPEALTSSATAGYLRGYAMVCVGGAAQAGASSTCAFRLGDDGSIAASIALSSATVVSDDTLNTSTIAADSILACYVTGTATTSSHATFYCRRVLA